MLDSLAQAKRLDLFELIVDLLDEEVTSKDGARELNGEISELAKAFARANRIDSFKKVIDLAERLSSEGDRAITPQEPNDESAGLVPPWVQDNFAVLEQQSTDAQQRWVNLTSVA